MPKKSNTALIIAIILGGFGICCIGGLAVTGYAGCKAVETAGPLMVCGMGFEMTRTAVLEYAKAHNGVLPKAATWENDVRQYFPDAEAEMKKALDFLKIQPMRKEGPWGCTQVDGPMTGIAFNDALSGKKLAEVKDDDVLLFETETTGRNLHQAYKERAKETGPFIVKGRRRAWFVATARGELKMGDENWNMDFDSKSN